MRTQRIRPVSRQNIVLPTFRRELATARTGGVNGYIDLGFAFMRRVMARPTVFLGADGATQFADLVARVDVEGIVRLFVVRAPWVLRSVPARRRRGSFAEGVRAALDARAFGGRVVVGDHERDHQAILGDLATGSGAAPVRIVAAGS